MTVRSSTTARPSNQGSMPPPELTPEIAVALAALPRRTAGARRVPAAGEVWLQAEGTADGWIRCRAVEVGMGSLLLLAGQSPTIAQGTWARVASGPMGPASQTSRANPASQPNQANQASDAHGVAVASAAEKPNATTDAATGDGEQVRVFPLALYRVGDAVVIECETPVDPALMARLSAR